MGRNVQVTDPRNLVTQTPRNGLGDVTSVVSPDTGTAANTYDAAGNLKTRTDSRGVLATHTYDELGRRVQTVYSQSGHANATYTWTYDQTGVGYSNGIGRLTSTAHPSGSTQYTYDAQGRVLTDTQRVTPASDANATQISKTVTYAYDAAGKVTSMVYPSGRKLTMTYAGGELSALALAADDAATPLNLITEIKWAPFGGIKSWYWQLASGTQLQNRLYDTNGRVIRYRLGESLRDLSYDAANRITAYTHYDSNTAASQPSLDQAFTYDELGRLTSINSSTASWAIGYDANGNRTGVTLNGTASSYTTAAASNRLNTISNPARSFAYDAAGNTLAETYTATYDLSGRMSTLAKAGITTTYSADGAGRRVRKYNDTGAASTIVFVYDQSGNLIGEYSSTGGALREYVWLGTTPVAVFMPDMVTANPPLVYFIHSDHLSTPRVVMDNQGQQRWTWIADPFGAAAANGNPQGLGAFTFNLRFPGQYFDQESGLHYNYFRNYDASTGRYAQSDPIGLQGGVNTYAYVESDPVGYIDPTGLVRWTGTFGGGGLISVVGASFYKYDLTSDCVDGQRARVQGYAIGGSAGIGLTAAGSFGNSAFEDNETSLLPDGFNGRFAIYGAGFALGRGRPGNLASESALNAMGRPRPDNGASWSDVILGNARTAPGANVGSVRGIDISASFTAGSSIVTSITYTTCECER